jgi:hypothetical protein
MKIKAKTIAIGVLMAVCCLLVEARQDEKKIK